MSLATRLPEERLYRPCDLAAAGFKTTAELEPSADLVGQDRARAALALAVGMHNNGYNVFVLGPPGTGRRSLVRRLLEAEAANAPVPPDWCYVNNFKLPHRPRALRLPPGHGVRLRGDMRVLVEELTAAIPALFESEEYRTRADQLVAQIDERTQAAFEQVGEECTKHGLALLHTPAGFSIGPVLDGDIMSPEKYAKLPEEERQRLEAAMEQMQGLLQKAIREAQRLQRERRTLLKELNRTMTLASVSSLIEEIEHHYPDQPDVLDYLSEVKADVLEHIEDFRRAGEPRQIVPGLVLDDSATFQRYQVNVVIGEEREAPGAPVVIEDNPTYPNLLGRIEHVARFGTLVTDFTLIKAGALHRANGAYLLIDAYKLLAQPFAWDGLKRALSSRQLRTESLGQSFGLISTQALEPEPIPLDVKVVLIGERWIYHALLALDREFGELFKIAADFEDVLPRVPATELGIARLMAAMIARENLRPLERPSVERVIEYSARLSGDALHLSTRLEALNDLVREADYFARQQGSATVAPDAVEEALAHQRQRASRVQEQVREAMLRGEIIIDTTGRQVAQVNALSVAIVGGYAFGHPTRITATTRLGDGEVVDIQREVHLGGDVHSKGVLILAAFLASRYSSRRPHCLRASLAFEQTYGEVDGDSASIAELCALLSSLANVPINQALAVTGSVNQHGVAQPVGAINEKIEGFFGLCDARGLTGEQGVLIPASNADHLMLDRKVRSAVAARRFSICTYGTIDEAVALLCDMEAGQSDPLGGYAPGTINGRVAARLAELASTRAAFAQGSAARRSVRAPRRNVIARRP